MDLTDAMLMLASEAADHPALARLAQSAHDRLARGEPVGHEELSEIIGQASGTGVLRTIYRKYSPAASNALLMPILREIGDEAPVLPRRRPPSADWPDPLTASTW